MKIKKLQYSNRDGKVKTTKNYVIDISYKYRRLRISGTDSKSQTEQIGSRIENLISYRHLNKIPPVDDLQWLKGQDRKLTDKLVEHDIIRRDWVCDDRGLDTLMTEFEASLRFKKFSERSISTVMYRVRRLISDCGFIRPADITLRSVQHYLTDLTVADQTRIHYAKAIKQFCRWLTKPPAVIDHSPLEHLPTGTVSRSEQVEPRRILTTDEIRLLLNTVESSVKVVTRLSGHERGLLYRITLETGLRRGEIAKLRVRDIDFQNKTVMTRRKKRNSSDGVSLPLRSGLCERLKSYCRGKLPNVLILRVPGRTADMLKVDLKDAGIEYENESGRVDFHSLRHCFASMLVKSGCHPRIAQELLRHSTVDLTMSIYSHISRTDTSDAVNALPDFENAESAKNGTETG